MRASRAGKRPGALILVQNLPVPFDRRVWQEARALHDAGFEVSVICPSSPQWPAATEDIDGVHIHRYRPRVEARTTKGYLLEYGVALPAFLRLTLRVMRSRRVDVIQACNPPDLLFLVALPFVLLGKARFVFDHHDVSPELLMAKGQHPESRMVRLAKLLERLTFGCAVVSIATNESYRDIAIRRGGMAPEDVFVVRSGPADGFSAVPPDRALKVGRRHLVGYVGVMGIQEGLDQLLDAAALVLSSRGRHDVSFALVGDGPEADRLRARARAMGLADDVRFLGRLSDADLLRVLSTADVCVNPDDVNPMNDISTMNKVLEYMALGRPVVQYETREGRVSAGPAAAYAAPNDPASLADEICRLLDDEALREAMGEQGQERFRARLAWSRQVPNLLAAYERALAKSPRDVNLRRLRWWRDGRGGRPRGYAQEAPAAGSRESAERESAA